MNTSRKILATAGLVLLSAVAVPGISNATSMYDPCTAAQEGSITKGADGSTLECVQSGGGFDWEWEGSR